MPPSAHTATRLVLDDRYELVRELGHGTMGEVWLGYDRRLDRRVAVKLIKAGMVPDGTEARELEARFLREARVMARLENFAVPSVHDVGRHEGRLYLVMRLVDGCDLGDFIAEHEPVPVGWAVAVAAQICAVLAVAHAMPLVHRDLKPSNVMISRDGTVTVLDFGVAALLDAQGPRLTRDGVAVGTPAYMAPEQLTLNQVSPRTDLYALGCLVHELLAGAPVFGARTSAAVMLAHTNEPPTPLRRVRDDVPEPIERLVLDLLAKTASDRPADAQAVYRRLAPFLAIPEAANPFGSEPPPFDPTRPYRFPLRPLTTAAASGALGPATPPREIAVPRTSAGARPRPPVSGAGLALIDEAAIRLIRQRAFALVEANSFIPAADLLTELLARAALDRVPDDPLLLGIRLQLADTWYFGGDPRRALPEYERLADAYTRVGGVDDDYALHCRAQLVSCLTDVERPADALNVAVDLLRDCGRAAAVDDHEMWELREQIAGLRVVLGDMVGARADYRALLDDVRRATVPGDPTAMRLRQRLDRLRGLREPRNASGAEADS